MKTRALSFCIMVLVCCGLSIVDGYGEEKAGPQKVFKAQVDKDGIQRVEVKGDDYLFTPKHIVVKVNVPVEMKISKVTRMVPHNIVLKAPEAGMDFDESMGNDPKIIKFTPTKTGKYTFYCSKKLLFFQSHRDKGMEGILEVID